MLPETEDPSLSTAINDFPGNRRLKLLFPADGELQSVQASPAKIAQPKCGADDDAVHPADRGDEKDSVLMSMPSSLWLIFGLSSLTGGLRIWEDEPNRRKGRVL